MGFESNMQVILALFSAIVLLIAFLGRRYMFGQGHKEKADLINSYASIASTMKSQNLTAEDIEAVAALVKSNKRQSNSNVYQEKSGKVTYIDPYWTQSAMNERAAAANNTSQAQLEEAITELRPFLADNEVEAFLESQDLWKKFRDAEANFESLQAEGGSLQSLIYSSEAEALNKQRIMSIRAKIESRNNYK